MAKAFVGTSGFTLQSFYPDYVISADKLSYYVKEFPTVEINSTFYHLPMKRTIRRWLDVTPSEFVFTFKVWQNITHLQSEGLNMELLDTWFSRFEEMESNKHIMLFQFPGKLKLNVGMLEELLSNVPKRFKYAFEFRHSSWFTPEVYRILQNHNSSLVIADGPTKLNGERLWPLVDEETADFCYIRFHGSTRLYYSSYSPEELAEYAQLIRKKIAKGIDVFCYFNNDAQSHASENARDLRSLVE